MPNLPLIPPVGTATTLDDLEARTRDLLSEETQDFYQDTTEIDALLNEALYDLFGDLDALPSTYAADTAIGDPTFTLPADIARIKRVRYIGADLAETTIPEYHELDDASGTPTNYLMVLDATGNEHLVLYPTPSAIGEVIVDYMAYPPALSASQGPTWHTRYHYLPCYYAAADLMDKDHLPEYGDRLRQKYEMLKQQYREWLAERFPRHSFMPDQVPKGEM